MRSSLRVPLLLFAVAWGTNHFVPLLVVYRARLALSAVELAVLFGVYAVGLVPGLLLGGPASDRWGRRRVAVPASVVALVGTCILAWGAAGFGVLLAGRFVVGMGAGATFSAGTAWVQDLAVDSAPGTGARHAAVALSSGFGGGPLVGGIIAQWLPGPMVLPYVVHGAILTSAIAAAAWPHASIGKSEPPPAQPVRRERLARLERPRDPLRLPAGFASVAFVAPWVFAFPSVSNAVLPTLLRARVGSFAVLFAGVLTGATLLCGVLVQPILRTWRPSAAGTFGLVAGAIGLLCAAGAAAALSPVGALLAAFLLGSGYGGCLISGLRFIEANGVPATRGRLTGLYYALTYLGFATPLALAAIATRIGDVPSLLVAFALAVTTLAGVAVASALARPPAAART